jgi:hypothetical protein
VNLGICGQPKGKSLIDGVCMALSSSEINQLPTIAFELGKVS